MNSDHTEPDELRPPWATGRATSPMQVGAQLCTRDGRRIGNAVTTRLVERHGLTLAIVATDIGNEVAFTEDELAECFHPPEWLTDLATHAGVATAAARTRKLSTDDLAPLPHLVVIRRTDGTIKVLEYDAGAENQVLAHHEAQNAAIDERGSVVLVAARYRRISQ